jgi:tetratricopeptide (TPR) repeat protein
MGKLKRIAGVSVSLVVGIGAAVALFVNGQQLDNPWSLAGWGAWWFADSEKHLAFLFVCLIGGINAARLSKGLFTPSPATHEHLKSALTPIATKTDLENLGARLVAKLAQDRAPDAPPQNKEIATAQAATVSSVLTSQDALDAKAKKALAQGDINGAIEAILSAAREDREQSARRYREAGTLAYGRNVALAIDAFSQAEKLDPGDFLTRHFLVRLFLAVGNSGKAEEWARSAQDAATDEQSRMVAVGTIADVLVVKGDLVAAKPLFDKVLSIAKKLAIANLSDGRAQRDVAVSLNRTGDILARQGDLDGALKAYREGLDVVRILAAADPFDAKTQRDVSISLDRIGNMLARQGDLDGALKVYREGSEMRSKLAAADSSDAQAQRDVYVSLNKTGDMLARQDDLDGALKAYREGLDVVRKLATADPSDAQAQSDISVCLERIGNMLALQSDLDGALKAYREGLEIWRKLAAVDPSDARVQRGVSVCLNKTGNMLALQGDLDGAFNTYREGLEIRRKLAAADTIDAQAQRDVSMSLDRIGNMLALQGDLDGALKAYREGLEIRCKLADADPSDAQAKVDLGLSYTKLGDVAEAMDDKASACKHFREAQELLEAVLENAPEWKMVQRMAQAAARDAARNS